MSLQALLDLSSSRGVKIGLSEERIRKCMPELRKAISFYREYPDIFVDDIKGPDCPFQFYFYQRVFLRCVMRHRYVYATFPRGYSKSFLSMMALMLRCIFYPNSALFVTTGGKEQAATITIAKVEEICKLIPPLAKEISWARGDTKKSKDNVKYIFKNGSTLDILAARESSRGQRRTGGLMEETILIDGTILNEVIIPTTVVDRLLPDGSKCREEPVNYSQTYITTAGWKNSFAYDKLIELLIKSMIDEDEVMILGGTYETPIMVGLQSEDFIEEQKMQGTYSDSSFDREYRSIWSGDAENAYFSLEKFNKHRQLQLPENEYSAKSSKSAYYVLGVDVGRKGCNSEVMVIKVTPQIQGASHKTLVNIYSFEEEHFEKQAIRIKQLYYRYKCRICAIDANGLGIGLIDFMVLRQEDPETGEIYPPFGVENDDEGFYKKFRTDDMERDAMYLIKANAPINSEAHAYVQTQLTGGKINFLIDEQEAKAKLLQTKVGQEMTPSQRADRLRPYVLTTILRDQMLNLVEENDGVNIILKQNNKAISKDKFSALEYGLLYIKRDEERKRKRYKGFGSMMFFN